MTAPLVQFGTKAETLNRIKPVLRTAIVDELYSFAVGEWYTHTEEVLQKIASIFSTPVIVRSSALSEDASTQSNAGRFTSVPHVDPSNNASMREAITTVINSYTDSNPLNQVFVQIQLVQVSMSGVMFTRDLSTLAPYLVINYDDESGSTDTVTSGGNFRTKTMVIFKDEHNAAVADPRMQQLLKAAFELEAIMNNDALDIEFAFTGDILHILQVRPIVRPSDAQYPDTKTVGSLIEKIKKQISDLSAPHPDLYGKETLFGIMPDWNPAEMIGIKPRPLALSLYRELITDSIWAYQRSNYGYKNLRSFPLMVSFAGHPHVDVRVDFNSWIPKELPNDLSHKLADFYIKKLKSLPESHDKIEFDIVYTCYTFDLEKKLEELLSAGFTQGEIDTLKTALYRLTKDIIGSPQNPGLYHQDLERIDTLNKRRDDLLTSALSDINKIYWLIEDCKRYGTLPFAGIARAGFVAVLFLNSLVDLGIITRAEKNNFMNSLKTVAGKLSKDIAELKRGELSRHDFLREYGHLRPGTYDITLESYAENFEKYFDVHSAINQPAMAESNSASFRFASHQITALSELLSKHDLDITPEYFLEFLRTAIEGREYAKFMFTRSVSELLTLVKKYGQQHGLTADDLSYLEISSLVRLYSTVDHTDSAVVLRSIIARNRAQHDFYKYLKLPHLICHPNDLYAFALDIVEPNYITVQAVEAMPIVVTNETSKLNLAGKIVFIESADPGFDWVFSHNIKGIVTMYGGANSHMAIRAAELNIPGVIGCGPVLFNKWSQAHRLKIDCSTRQVVVLS